jgi:hypothetical protein
MQKLQVTGLKEGRGFLFKLFHSSTAQSIMVDTFESHSAGMTKE